MGLAEKIAAFARRLFPEKFLSNLDRRLESAKIALSAEEYAGVVLLLTISAGVAEGLISSVFLGFSALVLMLAVLTSVAAFLVLTLGVPHYLASRRAAKLEKALPDALRQMASTLRAGMGIDAAMEDLVKSRYGMLSDEFDRVVTEVRRGRPLDSALLALARRSNSPLYERAFHLIVEGIERGAALASVLDAVSTDIREVHAIQRERKATTTQQVLFLLAVALFAAPFVVGLTVAVTGIQMGGVAGGLPAEMGTIALAYILIQAFICSLAVGVIRYGKMMKGLTFALPFMISSAVVFSIAKVLVGGMVPA